jgi:hypothetical protein
MFLCLQWLFESGELLFFLIEHRFCFHDTILYSIDFSYLIDLMIGYRRVVVECDNRQKFFHKFLLKCGFKLESILRKNRIFIDRNSDTAMFVILNTEWNEIELPLRRKLNMIKLVKS